MSNLFFFCFPEVSWRGCVIQSHQCRGFPLDLRLLAVGWGFFFPLTCLLSKHDSFLCILKCFGKQLDNGLMKCGGFLVPLENTRLTVNPAFLWNQEKTCRDSGGIFSHLDYTCPCPSLCLLASALPRLGSILENVSLFPHTPSLFQYSVSQISVKRVFRVLLELSWLRFSVTAESAQSPNRFPSCAFPLEVFQTHRAGIQAP